MPTFEKLCTKLPCIAKILADRSRQATELESCYLQAAPYQRTPIEGIRYSTQGQVQLDLEVLTLSSLAYDKAAVAKRWRTLDD
jgi:hypothetical protein